MTQKNSEPAKLISLLELFEGKKFEIPDYQRGYSWDEEQIIDLLTDIEMHNNKSGHKHFTGTIVVERPNGGDVFQIVDGQQRLVSCVMILRAIVEIDPTKLKKIESIIKKMASGYETALQLSDYDNEFFHSNILNHIELPEETASNKRLQKCYITANKWLREENRDIERIFNGIITQLGFIFFETSSARETTTMFEVINNRGKALSELEKFKNYFLHLCHVHEFDDLTADISSSWGRILFNLEKAGVDTIQKENQFVRIAFGVIFGKVKKDTDDLYKDFRDYIQGIILRGEYYQNKIEKESERIEMVRNDLFLYHLFLDDSSLVYSFLYESDGYYREQGEDLYSEKLEVIFKKLRNHGSVGSVMPLFLVLMEFYIVYPECREAIMNTLDVLEKLNFRFYCMPKIFYRSDTKRDYLIRLASEIYYGRNFDDKGHWLNELNTELQQFPEYFERIKKHLINLIERYCPESKFVEALTLDKNETYDFYSWSSLKFFLAAYENNLHQVKTVNWNYETLLFENGENKYLTKEHILAVDNKELFPDKESIEKRRLGNFILVDQALNNKLGTKNVSKKIEIIESNTKKLLRLKHIDEVVDLFHLTRDELLTGRNETAKRRQEILQVMFDRRETNMIKFALKEWRYPGEPKFRFEKVDTLEAAKKKRRSRYFPNYDA